MSIVTGISLISVSATQPLELLHGSLAQSSVGTLERLCFAQASDLCFCGNAYLGTQSSECWAAVCVEPEHPVIIDLCDEEVKENPQVVASLQHLPVAPLRLPPNGVSRKDFIGRHSSCRLLKTKVSPAFRRLILEVFKFLPISSIEMTAAMVNRTWFQVYRDNELWKTKYIEDFDPETTFPEAQYRAEYLDQQLETCWNCGQYIDNFGIECAPLRRLMCVACSQLSDCRIVPIKDLKHQFCVQESTLAMLKVPIFLYNRTPSTYAALMVQKVCPYYERRRDKLVRLLPKGVAKSTIKKLRQFDFRKVFSWRGSIGPKYMLALFYFCGKNEETENLAESLRTFMDHIKLL